MYIGKAIISEYTSYFHDGSLVAIEYGKNNSELILTLESAEVDSEEIKDPILISKDNRIKGKLHLKGIINIYIDGVKASTPLKMNYDEGDIFRFKIQESEVFFHIIWINYPPKKSVDDCSNISIKVEDVLWENIPDLKT
jgi:hypothetical protein